MTRLNAFGIATALVALAGCGSTATEDATEELAVDCGGSRLRG